MQWRKYGITVVWCMQVHRNTGFMLRLAALHSTRAAPALLRRCSTAASDPYSVLGVSRTATQAEIKARYKELALQTHPDVAGASDSSAEFKRYSEAYRCLSNAEERARFDESRALAAEQRRAIRATAVALAEQGAAVEAIALFFSSSPEASAADVQCAHDMLVACTDSRILQQRHLLAQTSELRRFVVEGGGDSAEACNAWFAFCLRHGQNIDALRAYKHAEAAGFEQSHLMQSHVRQVRHYQRVKRAERDAATRAAQREPDRDESSGT